MTKKQKKFAWLLFPLSLIYRIIVYIRNLLFDFNILSSKEFSIPIISIGNITVGGTGKTPHVEYIISLLKNEDFNIAVLSRGYKRKSKGFVLADNTSKVADIGDEPKQIKLKFPKVKVAVDKKRVDGVKKILNKTNSNLIILDDAFQHRWIDPGLSILLIDYNRPVLEDKFLPLGELRESPTEIKRANIVLITKTPRNIKPIEQRIFEKDLNIFPYQKMFFTTMKYGKLNPVFPKHANFILLDDCIENDIEIILITGIAQPKSLVDYINSKKEIEQHIMFPDHHNYTKKDIIKIERMFDEVKAKQKIIITTEKDAVRFEEKEFSEKLKANMFYIPLEIEILDNNKKEFNKTILTFVRKDKSYHNLII